MTLQRFVPTLAFFALSAATAGRARAETPSAERPVWLALRSESAFGYTGAGFYNHLAGVRLDYRPDPRFGLGLLASYANLKGGEGRVHNLLVAGMFEWRIPLARHVGVPVRGYTGYLPENGPWLKAASGLSFRLGQATELSFELLAPALWVVKDRVVGSFDGSVELAFRL